MTNNEYETNPAFCPLPWTGIYVEPNGRVDTCCISKNNIGNIHDSTVSAMVGSFKNIQIKTEMLKGTPVAGCSVCYPVDEYQYPTDVEQFPRNRHIKTHREYVQDKSFFGDVKNFDLKYADLRFRNTCNYACVYCSETLSSTWAAEKKIFQRIDNEGIENLVNYFCENAENVNEVCLAGGEPLMIKENERIVSALIEKNPECFVMVNTNLSQLKGNKIFELLKQLPNVMWVTSIDAMQKKYNYIRWPGDWDEFSSNLELLRDTVPSTHRRTFNMVYNSLNMIDIFDCVDWLVSNRYAVSHSYCTLVYYNGGANPTILDPRSSPADWMKQSNQRIQKEIRKHTRLGNRDYVDGLKYILGVNQVKLDHAPRWYINDQPTNIFGFLSDLDRKRKLNSVEAFPEIYAR
jgi:sulfatase maturation enzyme AslB (radical SAM superfamily)